MLANANIVLSHKSTMRLHLAAMSALCCCTILSRPSNGIWPDPSDITRYPCAWHRPEHVRSCGRRTKRYELGAGSTQVSSKTCNATCLPRRTEGTGVPHEERPFASCRGRVVQFLCYHFGIFRIDERRTRDFTVFSRAEYRAARSTQADVRITRNVLERKCARR